MTFTPPPDFTTRPTLTGSFGMSASTHWLATAASQSVLERGGNAFDAAVAGAFVLHIVEPHLNGPGGDMTGVFVTADAPAEPVVVNGQGPAPAAASAAAYRAEGLELVPGAGALAAAVPGSVNAWLVLLEEHGTWDPADVLDYAIHYAESGHPILPGAAGKIATMADMFNEHWPSSAKLWMPDGAVPRPGQTVRNPEYAAVLRELIAAGEGLPTREERVRAARHEWNTGTVARAIAAFNVKPHRHANGLDHAGVMTLDDFAALDGDDALPVFESPTTTEFRGHTIAKTGPWGQGPVLLQALKILDGMDDSRLDPSTELGAHTILEALKLALADRDAYYGSAAEADEELMADLLSEEYAAERRALIADTASHEFRPGSPGGRVPPFTPPLVTEEEWMASVTEGREDGALAPPGSVAGRAAAVGTGEPTVAPVASPTATEANAQEGPDTASPVEETTFDPDGTTLPNGTHRGDTCHLDIVDRRGNMISATPSGGWLHSNPTVPGLGFCLGTRLQMTWLDEDSPSRLTPGRRPRTTLSPTLILKDGKPLYALGTPGGDQQDQWQLLLVLRLLVGGLTIQEAIDAPAFHTTSMPESFYPRTWTPGGAVVEGRLGDRLIAGLEERGHRISRAGDWALGRLSCVGIDPETGQLLAGANPRGAQGYAAGR